MTCTAKENMTAAQRARQMEDLEQLKRDIGAGVVRVIVGRNGAFALKGWKQNREGISDVCAYRALANAPEMRRAVMRAEAMAGVKLSMIAVATGTHSHDGGETWHGGH